MKRFSALAVSAALLFSCAQQKEIIKPKEEIVPVRPVEIKKTLSISIEELKPKTSSSLRGISVIDSMTVWGSGSNGTIIRTTDGGKSWTEHKVKGFETLDFRDIEAFDKNSAIIMSVDAPAFFFKTTDGGKSWKRKYMNRDPNIFFDGFAFWDEKNGIALSDPIEGKFYLITTKDGGENWKTIPSINIPPALKGESAFAASGTSISVLGKSLVWFGTGGAERSRIFLSEDSGENWRAMEGRIKAGNSSSGVFSVCFKDDLNGFAVGGDYKNDKDTTGNYAVSDDGGLSWQAVTKNKPSGFRSCVAWNEKQKILLSAGTSGSDYSEDEGKTWKPLDGKSYNSIGISKTDGSCYLAGDKGAVARVRSRWMSLSENNK
jgi:photosystem II stability/assembly factor-like uncharacterized protein